MGPGRTRLCRFEPRRPVRRSAIDGGTDPAPADPPRPVDRPRRWTPPPLRAIDPPPGRPPAADGPPTGVAVFLRDRHDRRRHRPQLLLRLRGQVAVVSARAPGGFSGLLRCAAIRASVVCRPPTPSSHSETSAILAGARSAGPTGWDAASSSISSPALRSTPSASVEGCRLHKNSHRASQNFSCPTSNRSRT